VPLIAPKPPKLPKAQTKPLNRAGGTAGGQFEELHPRGRGGKWIAKPGDGYGSQGPDQTTAQLQRRLNQLGFKVPVDGQYGQQTAEAVQEFQKRYGLSSKLGVDAATRELLINPPAQTLAQVQREKGIGPFSKTARAARASKSKSSSSSSTKKITPAQAAVDTTVSKETKQAIKASVDAANQAHQTRVDTNIKDARHDVQQARGDAARAEKLAQDAKAAAAGGSAQARKDARAAAHTARSAERDAKGALKALNSLKKQLAKEKAARLARAQAPLPGEVAVLAHGPVHVHAGGGGTRMKLTPPIRRSGTPKVSGGKANVQVATSAELPTEQPGLEEGTWPGGNGVPNTTTVAFGYGGAPSLAIPDGRALTPPPSADLTIPDGRDTQPDVLAMLLHEAVAARKAAKTGAEFTRALARERVLRARLAEGLWDSARHPRGRGGKWVEVLNKLMGGGGAPARLHMRHLEDMGDPYLNARLHPDSDATDAERSKIRDIQARRRRSGVPSAQRPLSQVQRPLAKIQRPLSQTQKPLAKIQRSLADVQKPLYEASYEEVLHPRGRGGKWIDKLGGEVHAPAAPAEPHLPEAATDAIIGSLGGKRGPEAYDALVGGAAVDTQKHHQTDGKYTLARQVLHQQIVDHFFEKAQPATGKPKAIFTAGGAASGKSALAGQARSAEHNLDVPKGAVYINPDDIKEMLPEYNALKKQGREDVAAAATHEESSDLAKLMTGLAMNGHYPIIVDGTGNSHVGKFGTKLKAAADAGYDVEARYAHVPVKEAISREQSRAKRTGRKVAERLLREQHQTVAESYVKDVAKMPNVHVKVFSTVERGRPKLIADKPAGKAVQVHDQKQYDEHVAKATEVTGA